MSKSFASLPASKSVRLIEFTKAKVVNDPFSGTYFLIVSGTKPYLNMTVELKPRVYVARPEYWEIEVIGSLPGIGLPSTAPYLVFISLAGILGSKGIEVIGA